VGRAGCASRWAVRESSGRGGRRHGLDRACSQPACLQPATTPTLAAVGGDGWIVSFPLFLPRRWSTLSHALSLIEVCQLRRCVSGRRLLDDVSLRLEPGERLAIRGPSGSGKSLLLRSIAMLEPIDRGEIRCDGRPITPATVRPFRRDVQYVRQQPARFEGTVESMLRLPFQLQIHRGATFDGRDVRSLLASVGRPASLLDQPHDQLSGGEAQLVALVAALQLQPTVLLLDEPTAALDPEATRQVETLVDHWYAASPDRRGLIWVSHDADQLGRRADRCVVMRDGQLHGPASVSGSDDFGVG